MTNNTQPLTDGHHVRHLPCNWLEAETTEEILQPWPVCLPNEEQMKVETNIFNDDVLARIYRFLMIWSIPLAMLIALDTLSENYENDHFLSRVLGASLFLMHSVYFINLARLMWPAANPETEAHLFKVQTKLSRVEGWATMRIANTQLLFPHRPIQSISEFSAIAGGQARHSIANLGPIAWVGLVMMYGSHMQYDEGSFRWDIAECLIIIGVSGIVMIGMFELNHFDQGMRLFHYVGVGMAICILAASLIQGWSLGGYNMLFPLMLNVVAWPCFLTWRWYSSPERANQFQEKFLEYSRLQRASGKTLDDECRRALYKKINRFSVKCILLEGIAIYCTTTALAWYLYQWGNTCTYGCMHRA